MIYKAIIFDFFDVIHRDPFQHWLKQSGYKRDGELHESSRLLDLGDIDDEHFYQKLSELSGQPLDGIRAAYNDTSYIDYAMIDLIKQLKKTYKTALLSNSSIKYIWDIIKQYDVEPLFDNITVSAEVRLIKPDPKIFEHILDKLDVKAEEAIFIDDNPKNVEAASGVGINSLVYSNMDSLKSDLSNLGIKVIS